MAVIGAGPSGIAAAKEAMAGGMEVTVFEQTGEIGGTWVFREKEGQSSVYRSTFINTSKQFMCFSDYPMAESLPTYPHHKQIIKYFRDYAKVRSTRGSVDVVAFLLRVIASLSCVAWLVWGP